MLNTELLWLICNMQEHALSFSYPVFFFYVLQLMVKTLEAILNNFEWNTLFKY